jgi:hypothetical protein
LPAGDIPPYRVGYSRSSAKRKTVASGLVVKIYQVLLIPQLCVLDLCAQIRQFFLCFCLEEDIQSTSVKTSVKKFVRKFCAIAMLPVTEQTFRWMVPSFPEMMDPATLAYNGSFLMFATQFTAVQMNEAANDESLIVENTKDIDCMVSGYRTAGSEEKGKMFVMLTVNVNCRVNWKIQYTSILMFVFKTECLFPLTGYRADNVFEIDVSSRRHLAQFFKRSMQSDRHIKVTLVPLNSTYDVVLPNLFDLFKKMLKMGVSELLESGLSCFFNHFLTVADRPWKCECDRLKSRLRPHAALRDFKTPDHLKTREGVCIEDNFAQMRACHMVIGVDECIVHIVGPPGTGKTALIAGMIGNLVRACEISRAEECPPPRAEEKLEPQDGPTCGCICAVLCETANSAANAAVKLARAGHDVVFVTSESRWYADDCDFHNMDVLDRVCVFSLMDESKTPPRLRTRYREAFEAGGTDDLTTYAQLKQESQSEFKKVVSSHTIIVTNIAQSFKSGRLCFLEGLLDFIIVDEASQAHVHSVLLTLYLMRVPRYVLVGDPKQLGPLYKSEYAKTNAVSAPSLMELSMRNSPRAFVQLAVQYRMPPGSSALHSSLYYESTVSTDRRVLEALLTARGASSLAVSLMCPQSRLGVAFVTSELSNGVSLSVTYK